MAAVDGEALDALNREYQRDDTFDHLRDRGSQLVLGEGPRNARVMVLGGWPGRAEDRESRPFAGRAGAVLDRLLSTHAGVERELCYVTLVLKYRPMGAEPDQDDWLASRLYASAEIMAVDPRIVVLVGEAVYNMVQPAGDFAVARGQVFRHRDRTWLPVGEPDEALSLGGSRDAIERLRKEFTSLAWELLSV